MNLAGFRDSRIEIRVGFIRTTSQARPELASLGRGTDMTISYKKLICEHGES